MDAFSTDLDIFKVDDCYLQLASILPYVKQADDIGMFNQLHDDDFSLDPKWHESSTIPRRSLGKHLVHSRNALALYHLCRFLTDNLDRSDLTGQLMPRTPHPPGGALAQRLPKMPWSNVYFSPSFARRIGGCSRDLRIAVSVFMAFICKCRETFVFGSRN